MEHKFEELISGYMENSYGVCNRFIGELLARQLQQNLVSLNKDDRMKKAGIGNHDSGGDKQTKRGDKIFWIEHKSVNVAEHNFITQMESFITYLNNTCYTGINACEFHYALYESGNGYERHRDQFKNNQDRKFSMISYLNNDWLDNDGGELVIYQGDQEQKILPRNQKTVFFPSDTCEHAVLQSTRSRMSITGWLKCI